MDQISPSLLMPVRPLCHVLGPEGCSGMQLGNSEPLASLPFAFGKKAKAQPKSLPFALATMGKEAKLNKS